MKKCRPSVSKFIYAGLSLSSCLLAYNAKAQTQYLEPVVNGGTYSWDDPIWTANGAANAAPYTSTWVGGNFARFYNGSGDNYTVTVNAAESMAGMFLNSGAATTLNINDAGANLGSLSLVANTAQATQNGYSWLTQGFLTGGGTVNINAPITGAGGVEEESGGGNINLYGVNTFTGGFLASSSSTFIGFNNNASFGAVTSQIGFLGTTFAIMNNTGPSTVNIANPVQTIGASGVNFIGNSVTMSGNWYLGGGSSAVNIRNNGVAGTVVKLTGALSATSGTVTFSGQNGGAISLSGANSYTGQTTIGASGATSIRVILAQANTLANTPQINMAGGTLDPGGPFHQAMSSTKLSLSVNSTFDYTSGQAEMDFANSSAVAWTAARTLNLVSTTGGNWNTSGDALEFGTDNTGLTVAQLAEIEFNGTDLGDAALNAQGYIVDTAQVIPEPSAAALGLLGGMALVAIKRRRKA